MNAFIDVLGGIVVFGLYMMAADTLAKAYWAVEKYLRKAGKRKARLCCNHKRAKQ